MAKGVEIPPYPSGLWGSSAGFLEHTLKTFVGNSAWVKKQKGVVVRVIDIVRFPELKCQSS